MRFTLLILLLLVSGCVTARVSFICISQPSFGDTFQTDCADEKTWIEWKKERNKKLNEAF